MELSLSKTNRNKPLLILKGFHYVIHRGGSNSVNWRCCRYNYCKATLKTNKEITCIVEDNTENHTHELENTNSRENKENLKSIIELNPYAKPEQISLMYSECSSSTSILPNQQKIKSTINYERRKRKLVEPATQEEINVCEVITKDKENFLMFDNNEANNRIQIFRTIKDLERIMVGDEIMCDGTFKVVPSLFCQLFTIMAKKVWKMAPLFVLFDTTQD